MLKGKLNITVNEELTLDAGWWETSAEEDEMYRIVHPPEKTMFSQLLTYLEQKPETGGQYISPEREAIALTTLCLRWGSYLTVLSDRSKPLDPQAEEEAARNRISRISDGEMCRINIEASAALASMAVLRWQNKAQYFILLNRALNLLPIISQSTRRLAEHPAFWAIGKQTADNPDWLADLVAERPQAAEQAKTYPARVFANALINYSWRNNSGVEEIHAGQQGKPPYPLTHRRLRPAEERHLFQLTASRMVEGVMTLTALEKTPGQWADKIVGYRMSPYLFPHRWSLTEHTCQFQLPGGGSYDHRSHNDHHLEYTKQTNSVQRSSGHPSATDH